MKNIKTIILHFGVFYMILIVVLMMISYFDMPTNNIELTVNDDYVKQINDYKNKVSSLEDSSCKDYLNSVINRFEKDIRKENIDVKEYYEEAHGDDNILSYYPKGIEKCNILTQESMIKEDMPVLFLTASIQHDELIEDYIYQYELGFKDYKTREINETSLFYVRNNIKLKNELKIIDKLINIISSEEGV